MNNIRRFVLSHISVTSRKPLQLAVPGSLSLPGHFMRLPPPARIIRIEASWPSSSTPYIIVRPGTVLIATPTIQFAPSSSFSYSSSREDLFTFFPWARPLPVKLARIQARGQEVTWGLARGPFPRNQEPGTRNRSRVAFQPALSQVVHQLLT